MKKSIAIAGTHGVPAKYGGFETLAENLVKNLPNDYFFTVYCNKSIYSEERIDGRLASENLKLVYLPFSASGWQSYIYDFCSLLHAFLFHKNIIYLGPTFGSITVLNLFMRRNLITNYGGLNEWERPKYSTFEKWLFKTNIFFATKFSNHNVVDNSQLKINLEKTFKCNSTIIRYGGDHCSVETKFDDELKIKYPFTEKKYFLCIARAQVDTNLHMLIEAFMEETDHQLVIISNWEVSDYGRALLIKYVNCKNINLIDAIYDLNDLNFIRKNSFVYIHSHSYCGTAPSLVEAICLKLAIICFDVTTNRETTEEKSLYFSDSQSLYDIVVNIKEEDVIRLKSQLSFLIGQKYAWDKIAKQYLELLK